MKECSKSAIRRLHDSNFIRRYFKGDGIDIGGKPDPLSLYVEFFPLIKSIRVWDIEDGDAQFLSSVKNDSFDFVHSSHCLEHLDNPKEGLKNWFRILKPSGYLVVTVPEEDLYEQGVFPSTFNKDHKWTFTIWKKLSWSKRSINLIDLLQSLGEEASIERIELLNSTYREKLPRFDQTMTPVAECAVEFVVRKRTQHEILSKGRLPSCTKVDREVRLHLNQYIDDQKSLKKINQKTPPFENDSDI